MKNNFYFIRHGQSQANADNQPAGTLDSPLTEKGRAEALAARALVMALPQPPSRIFTSHLSRARDTAAIINEQLRLPTEEIRALHEQHYGDCQGLDKDTLAQRHGPDWSHSPPNGESFADFTIRVRGALHEIFTRHEGIPLIVGHGGMIHALGGPYNNHLRGAGNCAFLYFESGDGDAWNVYDCTQAEDAGRFKLYRKA